MKRSNLFEFEDFQWFPNIWRKSMTRLIVVVHKMFKTEPVITNLIDEVLKKSNENRIVDLCSGSGGPMEDVFKNLKQQHPSLILTMTDLYPNQETVASVNEFQEQGLEFVSEPVDAADVPAVLEGVRTMICSFHHMPPKVAREILENAKSAQQPLVIFELSDNSFPKLLAWTAFPVNIILCFFITPFVRPMTWYQLVFTYLIPVIPLFYAWDGAVSNLRTYTEDDLDELLKGLDDTTYTWKKEVIKQGNNKFLTLVGMPSS
ncbi:hypothetical protein [Parvicella tangerina]|uniref:Class I SAM-dependent methyltransferase n=1 Tax=Parvicella tangerina TaxID=2829795 RepID=A0A916JL01_9FLAO|nr:hypothetical protein [Parvicella tangerina]CAG5078503.1 hypothetical protein CRYO30217_00692 [Parvicella tangerina]